MAARSNIENNAILSHYRPILAIKRFLIEIMNDLYKPRANVDWFTNASWHATGIEHEITWHHLLHRTRPRSCEL